MFAKNILERVKRAGQIWHAQNFKIVDATVKLDSIRRLSPIEL